MASVIRMRRCELHSRSCIFQSCILSPAFSSTAFGPSNLTSLVPHFPVLHFLVPHFHRLQGNLILEIIHYKVPESEIGVSRCEYKL